MGMNKSPITRPLLLVRPHPAEFEAIPEYIQRLAKVNCFQTPSSLIALFGAPLHEIVAAGHQRLHAVIHGKAMLKSLRHANNRNHERYGISQHARVCISCQRESDILNARWSNPLAISCAKHKEQLLDHCPSCMRPILRVNSQYQCRCGIYFKEANPIASPAWEQTFLEHFTPWAKTDQANSATNQGQRQELKDFELHTAIFLRKLLNAIREQVHVTHPTHNKARLFASDHALLEHLANDDFAPLTEPPSTVFLFNRWQSLSETVRANAPKIVVQIGVNHRKIIDRRQQERDRLQQKLPQNVVTRGKISRLIRCTPTAAGKLLNDEVWCSNILARSNATPGTNLLDCLNKILLETDSVYEIAQSIGLPINWAAHFARTANDSIRLIPNVFKSWRIPMTTADNLKHQFDICRENAHPTKPYGDGYLHIGDISKSAIKQQQWIQDRLWQGKLPLAFKQPEKPALLSDFSIPLSAFEDRRIFNTKFPRVRQLVRMPDHSNTKIGQSRAIPT